MAGLPPIADDGDGFALMLPAFWLMEMATNEQISTLVEPQSGLGKNSLFRELVAALRMLAAFLLAQDTEDVTDFPGQVAGENAN